MQQMPDPSHARSLRWLIPVALFILVLGGYAHGQSPNTSEGAGLHVTMAEPDENGRVGEIVHHNRMTIGLRGERFYEWETEYGRVTLRLDVTTNNTCTGPNRHGCPDTLDVWELPEGIYADTMQVTTPEMGSSIITLFLWSGM